MFQPFRILLILSTPHMNKLAKKIILKNSLFKIFVKVEELLKC